MSFHRKNIRLAAEDYLGQRWFFITLCCERRRRIFTQKDLCNWFLTLLREDAAAHLFNVHAYCLMPDHVHLLLEGAGPGSNLLRLIKSVKIKSSDQFQHKTGVALWQKKFYDHILRHNDAPDAVGWYIWMNPVRAGLCRHPEDYPFLGSFTGVGPRKLEWLPDWLPPWRKQECPRKSGAAT